MQDQGLTNVRVEVRKLLSDYRVGALAIGYGLYRGANSLLYASALVTLPFPSLFISSMTFSTIASIAALLFALMCGLLAWRGRLPDFKLPVLVPAAVLAVLGIPAALSLVVPVPSGVFLGLSLLYGFASTCLNLAWLEMLAHQKLIRIASIFGLSMVVKGLVALLFGHAGGWFLAIVVALLVVISALLLYGARKKQWLDVESLRPEPVEPAAYRKGFMRVADAIVVSVVLEATVSIMSGFFLSATPSSESGLYSVLATLVASGIFCFMMIVVARSVDIERFYRYLFPVLLALVVLLPLSLGAGPTGMLQGLLVLVYDLISFSALYFVLRQLRKSGLSAYVLVAAVTVMFRIAQLLFGAIGYALGDTSGHGSAELYWVVIIAAVYGLSMLLLYVSRRRPQVVKERIVVVSEDDRFALRAQELKDQHKLTVRESEILVHLARGRSAAFIAEEFVCSPATVRTHMKSIYVKIDVHSKQELIDLFAD